MTSRQQSQDGVPAARPWK